MTTIEALILYWKVIEELSKWQPTGLEANKLADTIQALEELAKLKGED